MKKTFIQILCLSIVLFISSKIQAQGYTTVDSLNKTYLNWYNLDPEIDKIQGASVDRAYKELLKDKSPKKKIVIAVIDGGVDTAHVDLKGKIWTNKDEIPDNGVDDDNNGYVDDVYGWNFIGNAKGENITGENLEYVSTVKKGNLIYKNIKPVVSIAEPSINEIPASQQNDYKTYLICRTKYNQESEKYRSEIKKMEALKEKLNAAENKIKVLLGKNMFTQQDVYNIRSKDKDIKQAKDFLLSLYKEGLSRDILNGTIKYDSTYLGKFLNLELNPRKIVGDKPEDITDIKYGNNNVKGPDPGHGTLVAGIIAANRDNNIGINGIAENVEIMALRVVPDGDERDKDVALAIRYAVDNGANIINMSFGKAFSPQKEFVDDAVKYAERHNVLLVHTAGNDGVNNDSFPHFPNMKFDDGSFSKNKITVGASSLNLNKNFAAYFSNYGQCVDLFAPGVKIMSLLPENRYHIANGTSFSCPVVSGVAALVWSYYPELTAVQLKEIILKSSTPHPKLKVYCPNKKTPKKKKIKFSKLCKTGGTVNAYKALIMAEKFSEKK